MLTPSGVLCRVCCVRWVQASNWAARAIISSLHCLAVGTIAFFVLFCVSLDRLDVVSIIVNVYSDAHDSVTGKYTMYVESNNLSKFKKIITKRSESV